LVLIEVIEDHGRYLECQLLGNKQPAGIRQS